MPIEATYAREQVFARYLIDSGSAGNFMDQALAWRLQIPLQTLSTPIAVLGVSGEPLRQVQ